MNLLTLCTIASLLVFPLASLAENAKEINFNDLPEQVKATVLQEVSVREIKKVELIQEEETTKYEIESQKQGIKKDITVASNGLPMEIEQSMQLTQLPNEVVTEIKKDYPTLKIEEIESVQRFYFSVEGEINGEKIMFHALATGDIEDVPNDETERED